MSKRAQRYTKERENVRSVQPSRPAYSSHLDRWRLCNTSIIYIDYPPPSCSPQRALHDSSRHPLLSDMVGEVFAKVFAMVFARVLARVLAIVLVP